MYRVKVGHRVFELTRDSIESDAPNHFTAALLGSFVEARSEQPLFFDRDPELFEFIVRHLRGYTLVPVLESPIPSMSLEAYKANLLADAQYFGLAALIELLDPSPQPDDPGPPLSQTIWNPLKQRNELLLPLRNIDPLRLRFSDSVMFNDENDSPVVARFVAKEVLCRLSLAQYAPPNISTTFTHVLFTYSHEKEKEAIGFQQDDIGSSNLLDACFDIDGLRFTGKDTTECEGILDHKANQIPPEEFDRLKRLRWLITRGNRTISLFLDEMLFTVERAADSPCMFILSARGIRQEEYGWRTITATAT
ncbi:hypothetical protein SmJEL517_g04233 [Synchytrium microbalum]|uniref:Potassium channel tetramerisation-type BTB domain-containing protein n=1 Tax=Synchytrium microbalum TaxID=1806994 RepID=A0A507C5J9_9FUNG|nr:uncharacterized protein SmJEL517_g04233 [Synchytrium microbalum]TPX32735.1 hypothetical protein SmJEL517_g04233 [Synchytrium microbalum]